MVIDGRHDHSIRIPRPDLSERLHTPNACNQCHKDKSAAWAKEQAEQWYGSDRTSEWHFGESLLAAREHAPDAGRELVALANSRKYPDIARATAVSLLAEFSYSVTVATLQPLLVDPSPMVREAALGMVENVNPEQRWQLAGELLGDPVYAVRIEAARVLAAVPERTLTPEQRALLAHGVSEYEAAQRVNAEHPHSHVNLGLLYSGQRKFEESEAAYRQALRLDPGYVPAYINLADLFRSQGNEQQAAEVLLQAAKIDPQNAAVAHALGLHYVRTGNHQRALKSLQRAVQLAPQDVRYAYVYGVALYDNGRGREALAELERAHRLNPGDLDVLIALVSYSELAGERQKANRYAHKIADIEPRLGNADQILEQIRNSR